MTNTNYPEGFDPWHRVQVAEMLKSIKAYLDKPIAVKVKAGRRQPNQKPLTVIPK